MTTKFDEYVERREEARMRAKNEEINRLLLEGLSKRTKEEVLTAMLGELTFVVGISSVLPAKTATNKAGTLVF